MGRHGGIDGEAFTRLRSAIEQAPFAADGWNLALRALAQATGSRHAQLVALGDKHLAMNWLNDAPEDFQAESSRIEIYRPDVNYRIAALRAPMEITWEAHYDVARKAHTDEAYLELARKYGFEHGAQVVLAQKPGLFFGLALMRSPSEGRTGTSEHETLARIAPDILSAIRVQESIEQAGASLLHGALETMETAAILLDSLGRVTHVTPAAQRLLGPETLQLNGRAVRSNRPYIDRALGIRIGQALSGDDPGPADLWIRTGSGLLLVDVRPLPRGNWHLGTNGAAIVTLRPLLTPRVRAEDVADEKNFAIMAGKLATALALTHSEAEVTTLLAHGLSRKEIAALRHVSPQTVNTQLRMIFLKCEVNRESELVAIARSILDAIGS